MLPGQYEVVDNFLDKNSFKLLQESMFDFTFPWFKNDYKLDKNINLMPEEEKYNIQLIHSFYKDFKPNSPHIELLVPFLDKLNPAALIKIKANLTFCTPNIITYGMHTDYSNPQITTAVYYLNTNDGYTIFEDGQKVNSLENRLVMFDSQILHSGTSCTDSKYRAVLNINYVEEQQ